MLGCPLSRADLRSNGSVIAKIYTINHPMIDHLFSKSSVSLSQRVILSVSTYAAVFGSGAFHQYTLAPSHCVGMRKLTCSVRPPAPGYHPFYIMQFHEPTEGVRFSLESRWLLSQSQSHNHFSSMVEGT